MSLAISRMLTLGLKTKIIMNYKFSKKNKGFELDPSYEFGVDLDSIEKDEEYALKGLDWHEWTPQEIQMIIDKTEALVNDEEYDYQVAGSDFLMSMDKGEVHFFDWRTEQEDADFIWATEKFITFMNDFKKFIEENQ